MLPAAGRFFDMSELVSLLATYLDHKGISKLMRTNRQLHEFCAPAHYHSIVASYRPDQYNIFGSKTALEVLSKNTHLVRELRLGLHDLVYYFNCIVASQDLSPMIQHPSLRPLWLTLPDAQLYAVEPMPPMPPMTLLTKLEIDASRQPFDKNFADCPYYLPSYRDPRATTTQICWLLHLNPRLTHVTLSGLVFKDHRDVRVLTTSIHGLNQLQELSVTVCTWAVAELRLGWNILFSCPAKLRTLMLKFTGDYFDWEGIWTDDYIQTTPNDRHFWEVEDEACGLTETSLPRRQESLIFLTKLSLPRFNEGIVKEDILSMLRYCPNVSELTLPFLIEPGDLGALARDIVVGCPKLKSLTHLDDSEDGTDGELIFRVLGALPEQQVQEFRCVGRAYKDHVLDTRAFFQRHSRTLREVVLFGCLYVRTMAAQVLLMECEAIEVLDIQCVGDLPGLCISLAEAIKFPWACTRMRQLRLTIGVPDEPLNRPTYQVEPYYLRPAPTTLLSAEKEQFEQLEVFYRQIGALTEVHTLHLEVFFYASDARSSLDEHVESNTFPGMLSIGNPRSGRPGFLRHLGGLKNLKVLSGSVLAETKEALETMGWMEAVWMNEHWPVLEKAHFFGTDHNITEPFRWLLDQRRYDGKPLRLTCSPLL